MKYKTQNHFRKQIIFMGIFIFFLSLSLSATTNLTPFEEEVLENIAAFRMEIGGTTSSDIAVFEIEKKEAELQDTIFQEKLSDEVRLILDNILTWEKYNYLYEGDIKHPALEPLITAQYKEVKDWFKTHKEDTPNKWLYCTAGDILSCCMQFLPIGTAMSEGLTVKKYYEAALEQDPEMSFCLINIAQWYFYAPAISGGGKKKALNAFEKAVKNAKNPSELYHSQILLSQMLYENGQKEECLTVLDKAKSLFPESRPVERMKTINNAGYSWYDYTMNREKADKTINW